MSEIVTYAKAEFFRKPDLPESRICPKAECTDFRKSGVWIEHTTW